MKIFLYVIPFYHSHVRQTCIYHLYFTVEKTEEYKEVV